jgi:DNA-binding CsgD family transcriptional regulator
MMDGMIVHEPEHGRAAYRRRAWHDAFEALSLADQSAPLAVGDMERLAFSAYLIGREDDFHSAMQRAHHAHIEAGSPTGAARCAFWLALMLLFRGDAGQASGWLARAARLIEGIDCVEHGYLLLPDAEQHLAGGNADAAHAAAAAAVRTGLRFDDRDLIACARHVQGRALIQRAEVQSGIALLDDAMLAVVQGELSPVMTGLVYCSVIEACQGILALGRAREWTSALSRWCGQQPDLVAFTRTCLVHRAEIMQVYGEWPDALAEAYRACETASDGSVPGPPAMAYYRQAEIHRLRGEFATAEKAYRSASLLGLEPQPGLALLRLAQGRSDAACAAIRRVLSATADPLQRVQLLRAHVEIMLAAGEVTEAHGSAVELRTCSEQYDTEAMHALAAHAAGSVELSRGNVQLAVASLRRAFEVWQQVQAPYEAALVRVLIGRACRALGDLDAAALELSAARETFERLGAAPALAHLDTLMRSGTVTQHHGLSPREVQVLRLVAKGRTNRAIAAELHLSERTVDRHVSNLLAKLNVATRAAATACAYDRQIL